MAISYWLHRSALFSGRGGHIGQEKQLRVILEPWIPQSVTKKDTNLICKKEEIEAASFSQTVPRCHLCTHTHLPARHTSLYTCVHTIPCCQHPSFPLPQLSTHTHPSRPYSHDLPAPRKTVCALAVFCALPAWLFSHLFHSMALS